VLLADPAQEMNWMTILVTGSAGHLGEALMRTLRAQGRRALGSRGYHATTFADGPYPVA
jgi:nucleoside-diphosphate-sugar epimerase